MTTHLLKLNFWAKFPNFVLYLLYWERRRWKKAQHDNSSIPFHVLFLQWFSSLLKHAEEQWMQKTFWDNREPAIPGVAFGLPYILRT